MTQSLARMRDDTGERDGSESGLPRRVAQPWPNAKNSFHVEAAGSRWHVQRAGNGPILLLIHGTGSATHSWRDLLPLLARRYTVVAPDLPGHGLSEPIAEREMSLPGLSRRVAELLSVLDAQPVFVAGHSAGAAIALQMALDRLIAPQSIVGLNAALFPYGGPAGRVLTPLARLCLAFGFVPKTVARRARDRGAIERLLDSTGSQIDEYGLTVYQRLLGSETHVRAALSMMANWDLSSLIARLEGLDSRLALIVGARDRAVPPAQAERLHQRYSWVIVESLDNAGHLAHEEQPQRVARLMQRHLADHDDAKRARRRKGSSQDV